MPITSQQFREMEARLMPKTAKSPDAFTGKESELHRMIEDDLRARRWYFVHSRCDRATTTQKGVTDFIVAMPFGKVAWVEVKTKNGKLTPEQNVARHVLSALGHRHYIVRSLAEWTESANLMQL